ncbi:MAG: GntR family transcriptional regulator [Aggregatilineales bacterium]
MGLGIGDIQTTKNTANLVADALRSAIVQGKLLSGQSLKQDEIAAEFKVSKIPVREALVQLQAEGLVSMIPSRGATVAELTLIEVDEIYTIRVAMESIALRKAIPFLTPKEVIEAERILENIDHETDMTKWAELNWAYHETLYRPSKMYRLIQITKNLHNNVARYLLNNYLDKTYLEESQRQHRQLLENCKDGDINAAIATLEHHLGDPVAIFAEILGKN